MKSVFFAASALAATAFARVYEVTVGPGLDYSPDTITDAAEGDIISFTFGSGHNVVSGSFDNPCQPSGGIYSGDPQDGDIFSVTLNSTDPLWIYCSVPRHCQGGMAMVVNPPSGQTLDDYKSAASSVSGSSQPNSVGGGVFGALPAASSSAAASSASASATAASSASASSASASAAASSTTASGSSSSSGSSTMGSASTMASSATSASATAASSGNIAIMTGAPAALLAAAGLVAFL